METSYKRPNGFLIFLKKFVHHKAAVAAACIFALELLAIILLPVFLKLDAVTSDFAAMAKGPSAAHILGTDEIGRDIFARLVYGGRVSMIVGILSTLLSVSIKTSESIGRNHQRIPRERSYRLMEETNREVDAQ